MRSLGSLLRKVKEAIIYQVNVNKSDASDWLNTNFFCFFFLHTQRLRYSEAITLHLRSHIYARLAVSYLKDPLFILYTVVIAVSLVGQEFAGPCTARAASRTSTSSPHQHLSRASATTRAYRIKENTSIAIPRIQDGR